MMTNRILVIGDLIIDKTCYTKVSRISPEAPTPTADLIYKESDITPGGAGFAAAFSSARGNKTYICTAATRNNTSMLWFKYNITSVNADVIDSNITKTRFIEEESGYHLLRLDNDLITDKPNTSPENVLKAIDPLIKGNSVDGCLLADYKKGFFNPSHEWNKVIDYLSNNNIPTLLDTRMENIKHFMNENHSLNKKLWLKLNNKEADKVKFNLFGEEEWDTNIVPRLLITKGSKGLTMLYDGKHDTIEVPERFSKSGAPDTTGCGDIFDVSFITGLIKNLSPKHAGEYAVHTASEYAWIPFKEKLC